MELYITHVGFLAQIEKEIAHVLGKGNQMMVFYDKNSFELSETILDYISEDKIKIKKIPDTLVNSISAVAYELGKLFSSEEMEKKFVLWGAYPFPELYKLLLRYDKDLSMRVSVKTISKCESEFTDPTLRKKPAEVKGAVNKKPASNQSSPRKVAAKNAPEKSDRTDRGKKETDTPERKITNTTILNDSLDKKNNFINKKNPIHMEHSKKKVDIQESFAHIDDDFGISGSVFFVKNTNPKQNIPESAQVKQAAAIPKNASLKNENMARSETCITGKDKNIPPPPVSPPDVEKNVEKPQIDGERQKERKPQNEFEESYDSFRSLLEKVCDEPISEENATFVLVAVNETLGFTDQEAARKSYKTNLENIMSPKKAKYFYMKTKSKFDVLQRFFQ